MYLFHITSSAPFNYFSSIFLSLSIVLVSVFGALSLLQHRK